MTIFVIEFQFPGFVIQADLDTYSFPGRIRWAVAGRRTALGRFATDAFAPGQTGARNTCANSCAIWAKTDTAASAADTNPETTFSRIQTNTRGDLY
ncbi:hypothetical protein T31B1_13224 [Salinisphaera sp. T31B1]